MDPKQWKEKALDGSVPTLVPHQRFAWRGRITHLGMLLLFVGYLLWSRQPSLERQLDVL